jgi:hypothetical protein
VEGEQFDAKSGGGAGSGGGGIGDVVELEVEEDGVAASDQRLDHSGTSGDKEFQANLEPMDGLFELADKAKCGCGIGQVEGDDEPLASLFERVGGGRNEAGAEPIGDGHTLILKDF